MSNPPPESNPTSTESPEETTPAPASPPADTPVAVNAGGASPSPRKPHLVLCPYCGHAQQQGDKCEDCGGHFEPLSRRATQIAMGPWAIRSKAHPFRPGFSYPVLTQMIDAGRVGPLTVLRGPTTRQFWSIARNVPGVAHLVGYCHACGAHVEKTDTSCPSCGAAFKEVKTRNELGLQFPNRRAAEAAQRSLNRLLGLTPAELEPDDSAGPDPDESVADNESVQPDTDHELAAAAASGATPASIFEQNAREAPERTNDLISDVLGESVTSPVPVNPPPPDRATPTEPPPLSRRPDTPGRLKDTPQTAADFNPAALPPRRQINWLVWLLLAMNLLVALVIIYFVATRGEAG